MQLARFLNKLFKKDGFILIDANLKSYIIGTPKSDNPIKLKILDKKLHYKLLLQPNLHFGEAYTDGDVIIENGSLTDFLDIALKNIGRGEINAFGYFIKKVLHGWRYISIYNLPKRSKKNVEHHYDIGEELYDLFLDKKHRLYSCAYFL